MADPPQTLMAVVDIPMERGNNVPIEWALMNDDNSVFDITDSEFFLTITWAGGQIVKHTGVDANFVKNVSLGTVTYTPNLPESRMIRPGRIARYELERRQGTAQRVLMAGDMLGVGGDNVD